MGCRKSASQTEIDIRLRTYDIVCSDMAVFFLTPFHVIFFQPCTSSGTSLMRSADTRLSSSTGVRVSSGSRRYQPPPSRSAATISQSSTVPTTCLEATSCLNNRNNTYSSILYQGVDLYHIRFCLFYLMPDSVWSKPTVHCLFLGVLVRERGFLCDTPQQVLIGSVS